jgi:hypothetical protein
MGGDLGGKGGSERAGLGKGIMGKEFAIERTVRCVKFNSFLNL